MTIRNARTRLARPLLAGLCLTLAAPVFAQDVTGQDSTTGASQTEGVQNAEAMSTSKTDASPARSDAPDQARLQVSKQTAANQKIMIQRIAMPESGWVVVHYRKQDGDLSVDPIGTLHLGAGEYDNAIVPLSAPVQPGETLVVMLHKEDPNASDNDDYGNSDAHQPMTGKNGKPVKARLKIDKPADADGQQHTATSSGHIGNTKETQSKK